MQECYCRGYDFPNILYQFLLVDGWIVATFTAIRISGIVSQCLAECFDNTYVIYDKTVRLTFCHTVRTCNCLHQGMCLHWLIYVETRERFHVKACQPHGTNKDNSKFPVCIFEFLIKFTLLHFLTVWSDVKSPFLECLYLVLFLRYHNSHFRFFHPLQFALHFLNFLLPRILFYALSQSFNLFLPILLHIVVHADASHLVEAHH